MRQAASTWPLRAERRAAPKPVLSLVEGPARAIRETRMAFVPSKSAQADLEPRHSLPSRDRLRYSADEGPS
jgi:hypothetical protein